MPGKPVNTFNEYHAHVYFDAETVDQATSLCQRAGERFHLRVGRIHRRPVGPHPCWSCQLTFDRQQFDHLIPWLDEQRHGLSVLIHPLTGDDLADHTTHATWLGNEAALDLAMFTDRTAP